MQRFWSENVVAFLLSHLLIGEPHDYISKSPQNQFIFKNHNNHLFSHQALQLQKFPIVSFSLSQFQTQAKAHRFLLPSILNPKNHQIPLISIITLPFCLFPPHPLLLSSLPPCVPCYKTPQTDSFTFKCYWTTRCFCAQMLGSLAGTKHLLSLSLSSSSTRSSLLVFSSWRQFEFRYCLFVHS